MASKNQTPAPKVSSRGEYDEKGPRKELSVDHMESGYDKGISPEQKDEGPLAAKTTQQQQEERAANSNNAQKSLDIKYGMEGEGKQK
jgi:hypothetical protein